LCLLIWLSGNYVCRYECSYGLNDYHKHPNHMKLIKCGCLTHVSIKRFYTWPNVVAIIFYHRTHTRANGDPTHHACHLGSTSRMSTYAPCMFHTLEFIWIQLRLRYILKQIYDKHKEIWWAWANAGEWMTWDDFLQLQDITYLD
jgi:hypothetical protein